MIKEVRRNKISTRLILSIIAFSSLITIFITIFQLYLEYDSAVDLIDERIHEIEKTQLPGLTSNLWDLYMSELNSKLESLTQLPDIQYLEIHNNEKIIARAGNFKSENIVSVEFPMIYTREENSIRIGTLIIIASLDDVYKTLKSRFLIILLSNGAKTFIVSVFMYFLIDKLIIQRLSKIHSHLMNLDHSNLHHKIDGEELYSDEMTDLTNTIINLQSNLDESLVSKHYVENIIQSMNESLVVIKSDGMIKTANLATLKLLGYEKEEIIGHPITKLTGKLIEEIKTGNETHYINKTGEKIPIMFSHHRLSGDEASFGDSVCIATDISQLKKTEQTIKDSLEKAEAANEAKSVFMTRMSHELRTPLNAILGFSQMLLITDSDETDQHKECANYIVEAGQHLLMLINDILSIVHSNNTDIEVPIEDCDLNDSIQKSLNMVANKAKSSNVSILYNPIHLTIKANQDRLTQVLINLLTNAIKYNKYGGSVTVTAKEIEGNSVEITVEDTGIGISLEDQELIFEPFTRLAYAEHQEIQGTGVGLALAKFLVQQMKGTIGVKSQQERGSIFWLRFTQSERSPSKTAISHENNLILQSNYKKRILYIEDDAASSQLLKMFVSSYEQLGLITTDTAEKGIVIADEIIPDLILIDINLPEMNGIDALRILKSNPKLKNTPVVAISADAMPNVALRGMESGFDAFLTKPIELEQITDIIQKCLLK